MWPQPVQPPSFTPAPPTPVPIEHLCATIEDCRLKSDSLSAYQAQRHRIEKHIQSTVEAVIAAAKVRDDKKRAHETLLGGEVEGNMSELKAAKERFDRAESKFIDARQERTILRDARKTVETKVQEADKGLNEALTAVRDLARKNFKTSWSRAEMFARYGESEFTWRAGLLESILLSLPMGDLKTNLALLETFLRGGKFTVRVQRGFLHVGSSDDRRVFQRGEQISVPTGLPYRAAFEEVLSGRVQLSA
jgi:hypothetical protein